jgi:3-oxoacyl-(acyl-carrier-protein) synthase III
MIPVRILGTASLLPGRSVSTTELAATLGRNPAALERKTGILTRNWAAPGTSSVSVGAEVLRRALASAGMDATALRRIFFISSTGGDTLVPATAARLSGTLGLVNTCDTVDLGASCMGFLTGFDLAARSIATGSGPVALVMVELGSRVISPEQHRTYAVFGDAAAAVVLAPGREGEGVVGSAFGTDGTLPPDTVMDHPAATGQREWMRFEVRNNDIAKIALGALMKSATAVMAQAGMPFTAVEWVLPHQPNGAMLDMIVEAFGVNPDRVIPVVQEIGSVGAASIPFSLDRLLRTRPVRPGDHVLMAGVGAGVSHGAILYRVGG